MPSGRLDLLWQRVCGLRSPQDADGLSDRELMHRFTTQSDTGAFESLLRRHGPMVLGVARRLLGHHQDAEDVLQATFLLLAKKAASLRRQEAVGNWLHGVACRLARRLRTINATR